MVRYNSSKVQLYAWLLAVSKDGVLGSWDKKATPDEGWSIWEGFRKENGADSYTLSPADAKIERID